MGDAVHIADANTLARYIEGLFAQEDDVLRALRAAIPEAGFPEIEVSAEVGGLLRLLLTTIGARRVVEAGTLGGYSAIWMARALPADGRLITIEIEEARAALAAEYIALAGVADRVEVRTGDAHDVLRELAADGEVFDACFIDAEKSGYDAYLDSALELVRGGGLIMADNALWGGRVLDPPADEVDDDTDAVRAFNRRFASEPRFSAATIIPVRDGLAVGVVR